MILHCITSSILKYQTSSPWLNDFYSTRSFIDNKVIQAKGFLVSTLESLVFESEQYHPVAQTHLHMGLKCKIQIITSVRPQTNVPFSAIQLASMGIYQAVSFHQLLCTRAGEKGQGIRKPAGSLRIPGMNISVQSVGGAESETVESICLNRCYQEEVQHESSNTLIDIVILIAN